VSLIFPGPGGGGGGGNGLIALANRTLSGDAVVSAVGDPVPFDAGDLIHGITWATSGQYEAILTGGYFDLEAAVRQVNGFNDLAKCRWYLRVTSGSDTGGAYVGSTGLSQDENRSVSASSQMVASATVDASSTTYYAQLRMTAGPVNVTVTAENSYAKIRGWAA
jgi:hypothetical protein